MSGDKGALTLIIFGEAVGASHAYLPTRVGFIQHAVTHAWDIYQLGFVHRMRPPNGSRGRRISDERSHAGSTILGHTVPLGERTHQGHPNEIHNLWIQRCAPGAYEVDIPADNCPDFVEYQPIPERVGVIAGLP